MEGTAKMEPKLRRRETGSTRTLPANLGRRTSTGAEPVPVTATRSTVLLISGAASGGTSKLVTAPIDRVKIIYQVDPNHSFSLRAGWRTVQHIVNTSGAMALWRGNGAAMARDVPYAAIVFTSFALYEDAFTSLSGTQSGVLTRLAAGSAAGATATCLTYPLDVLRARLAAELVAKPRHASYLQGVRAIIATEGTSALFCGLRPTLLGIVPYSGLSFAAFETIKAYMRQRARLQSDEELSALQRLSAGGSAGLMAQTATYPLHVVRRRMQVTGLSTGGSIWGSLRTIYVTEGLVNGLFKGLTLALFKGPLQSAVGFAVNDYVKKWLSPRIG